MDNRASHLHRVEKYEIIKRLISSSLDVRTIYYSQENISMENKEGREGERERVRGRVITFLSTCKHTKCKLSPM